MFSSFGAGFFARLLCNVLFRTGAWHYFGAAGGRRTHPRPAGRGAHVSHREPDRDRFNPRAIALPGNLLFAAGPLLLAGRPVAHPHY